MSPPIMDRPLPQAGLSVAPAKSTMLSSIRPLPDKFT
jgi:hypothetical protein